MPRDRVPLDVAQIAALVRSCPLVEDLHGGRHGRIATSGQIGVRVEGAAVVVGVVGRPGATTGEIAGQVRSALSAHAPGYQVTVSVQNG